MRYCILMIALGGPILGNWGNGYTYKITATVASGQVTGTLTNFPAVISLNNTAIKTSANGGQVLHTCTQSGSSYDTTVPADFIITTDSAGSSTISGFEWESYSATAGTGLIWVNNASIAVGTVVYIWTGKSSVTTCQGTVSSTWNSNYKAVWHEPNIGGTLESNDSTSNANNSTGGTAFFTSGQIDGSAGMNGEYLAFGTGSSIENLSQAAATYSFWIYPTNVTQNTILMGRNDGNTVSAGWWVVMLGTGTPTAGSLGVRFTAETNTINMRAGIGLPSAATWTHIAIVGDGSLTAANQKIYVNGVLQSLITSLNGSGTPGSDASDTFYLGYNNPASDSGLTTSEYTGNLDEIHLATTALSASWIAAEYNNQSAPNTFWTLSYDGTNGGPCTMAVLGAGTC